MVRLARRALFVDEYIKDRNATQAAIRAGYSAKTAKQQGSRLLTDADIQAEVARRTAAVSEAAGLTLQAHLDRLNELATKAAGAEQYGPAVNAEVHRGKAVGLYVDKQEVRHKGAVTVRVKIEREGRRRA